VEAVSRVRNRKFESIVFCRSTSDSFLHAWISFLRIIRLLLEGRQRGQPLWRKPKYTRMIDVQRASLCIGEGAGVAAKVEAVSRVRNRKFESIVFCRSTSDSFLHAWISFLRIIRLLLEGRQRGGNRNQFSMHFKYSLFDGPTAAITQFSQKHVRISVFNNLTLLEGETLKGVSFISGTEDRHFSTIFPKTPANLVLFRDSREKRWRAGYYRKWVSVAIWIFFI